MMDVLLSSCARVDILERAVFSFLNHVKSEDGFRIVVCEDMVEDKGRQDIGREWLEDNSSLFDEVVYADRRLTYVYCFSEILERAQSEYFFRLEDDVEFDQDINVDEIVDFMKTQDHLAQLIFKRKVHPMTNPVPVSGIERKVVLNDFFSIATGVFSTEYTKRIVDYSGTGQCHETGVLTPAMRE